MVPVKIFCCYAREDLDLLEKLERHLAQLKWDKLITVRSTVNINAGDEWEKEVDKYLDTAAIILLLISSDFMNSPNCYNVMIRAMQRHNLGEARVIPILMRSVLWKGAPFSNLAVLPQNRRFVTDLDTWHSQDAAFTNVVENISLIVEEIHIEHYMREADSLCNDSHYEDAIGVYDKVLERQSENSRALLGKGEAQLLSGKYEASINVFNKGLRVSDRDLSARFYHGKAQALSHLHRDEESLVAYDEAIRYNPQDARLYNEKADVLLHLQRYIEALEQIDKAIQLAPQEACYYQKKGDVLVKLNNYKQAIELYDLAIRLDPTDVYSYEKKGDLLLGLGKNEEALAAYNEAIRLAPTPMYYLKRNILLLRLQRNEEVLNVDEEAVRLADTEPFYH